MIRRYTRPEMGAVWSEEARFAAMAFYGVIEQLLTGWIFGLLPEGGEHFEGAKWLVLETVYGGLAKSPVDEANRLPR